MIEGEFLDRGSSSREMTRCVHVGSQMLVLLEVIVLDPGLKRILIQCWIKVKVNVTIGQEIHLRWNTQHRLESG